jgi:O-methyltransferase
MIGLPRLNNLQFCVETALRDGVEGDFIETGVWRGGACIFMRGILKAYGENDRAVWVADSFEGLPPPDVQGFPADRGDKHHKYKELAVSLDEVKQNFERYSLLDGQVRFLRGWFKETLPSAPINSLAVCRLDGDMYESTMEALESLYPKVSKGGFLIVDDYGAVKGCQLAVDEFREKHGIVDDMAVIDWSGVYWRRTN